jgi:PPOX class probable F420-dependent enzyme
VIVWPPGSRALLKRARVARLATSDRNAVPHVVPICFAVAKGWLYSVVDAKPKRSATSLKRLRNIAENPSVAVLVDEWSEDWSRLAWTMLKGRAAVVTNEDEYLRAIGDLRAKYEQYRDMRFERYLNPLISVEIERVVFWCGAAA